MEKEIKKILAKGIKNGEVLLTTHLREVAELAQIIARNLHLDENIAYKGAILHDIGKTSPLFQQTLEENYQRNPRFVFRHEIASLFFISLLKEEEKHPVIEMVVAHHKSIYQDISENGILDLVEDRQGLSKHLEGFDNWKEDAFEILRELGFEIAPISLQQAQDNFWEVVEYCKSRKYGYSLWKGVLIAADHLASSLDEVEENLKENLFIQPDLAYYHKREHELYPLSLISTDDERKHTLVTAPTGAGKTDFLIRRCKGRIFYTLPFQASINAMYERIKEDLKDTNADIRLLHASSRLKINNNNIEEKILQKHIGASIKVLTPHQMASLAFATKGYEALIADLKGCDIILDEIHTYSETTQSIVLKIVDILLSLDCRIHIGTATMPSALYAELLNKLGGPEKTYQVSLPDNILELFNRHIINKSESLDSLEDIIQTAIHHHQKILIVCNRVKSAQEVYRKISEDHPEISKMLIHSRFKRKERNRLESELKDKFNTSPHACIVVSTQVVEVSLDISFDLMITECAPIDALIQRFGRINRKRNKDTIGKYKPIYVLAPLDNYRPYQEDVLKKTFEVLPDGSLLEEKNIQTLIDQVYPNIHIVNIDLSSSFNNGKWRIRELCHNPKSALLEALDIDSIACITEGDRDAYESGDYRVRSEMEIPVSYRSIGFHRFCKLDKVQSGIKPIVIPDKAYNEELGFLSDFAEQEYYDTTSQFL